MTNKPNIWGSDKSQRYRESFNGIVEVEAKIHQNELRIKQQFRGVMELVLRQELSVLLDENTRNQAVERIGLLQSQKAFAFDMQFIRQDTDFIAGRIQKGMASYGLHLEKGEIEDYLLAIDKVFKVKVAAGETITAIPYIGKFDTLEEAVAREMREAQQSKKPKRGKARPVVFMGCIYSSIRAAQKANPSFSYNSIQKQTLRQVKKAMAKPNEVIKA